MTDELNVSNELAAAAGTHAIDISQTGMPLDMTVRSVALTLAVRHCGDTVVSEGNLYQQLKMDNKLGGPLTPSHVLSCAVIFERYLWGEFSKSLAGEAVADAMGEIEQALNKKLGDEDPSRPHGGGE